MIEYHATGILFDAIRSALGTLSDEIILYGNEPAAGVFLSALRGAMIVRGF
jgi:hypothetical protein